MEEDDDMAIEISERHGVNPCIPRCFWCGEQRPELVLFGKLPGDREAPISAVVDYEPCDACREGAALGVALYEATESDPGHGMPPAQRDPEVWPTGRWVVMERSAAERLLGGSEAGRAVLRLGRGFLSPETWDTIGLPRGGQ